MKQNTFKILFFLRSNYLNKDGTAAIIVRISIDGERQEWPTKLSCEPAKWDKKSGRALGLTFAHKCTNDVAAVTRSFSEF